MEGSPLHFSNRSRAYHTIGIFATQPERLMSRGEQDERLHQQGWQKRENTGWIPHRRNISQSPEKPPPVRRSVQGWNGTRETASWTPSHERTNERFPGQGWHSAQQAGWTPSRRNVREPPTHIRPFWQRRLGREMQRSL